MGLEREREGGIIVKARIRFRDLLVIEKVGFEVRDHGTIELASRPVTLLSGLLNVILLLNTPSVSCFCSAERPLVMKLWHHGRCHLANYWISILIVWRKFYCRKTGKPWEKKEYWVASLPRISGITLPLVKPFFFFCLRGTRRNSIGFGEQFCACSSRFLNKNVHIHR